MSPDTYSTRWRVLTLLGFAELLGMSLWFSASAVTPQLRAIWGLTTGEAAWLTTIVQLGFVCGTAIAAVLNLADVIRAGRFFSVCALLGAAATQLFGLTGQTGIFFLSRTIEGVGAAAGAPRRSSCPAWTAASSSRT